MTAERLTGELAVAEFGNQVELSNFKRVKVGLYYPEKESVFAFSKDSAIKLRDWLNNQFPPHSGE